MPIHTIMREEFAEAVLAALDKEAKSEPQMRPLAITPEEVRDYLEGFTEHWGGWSDEVKRKLLLVVAPRIDLLWLHTDLTLTIHSPLLAEPFVWSTETTPPTRSNVAR